MLKQHCDFCDSVIPSQASYKTVHFGRGNNQNINIGYDPQVICKKCWEKMINAVKPEMMESEEQKFEVTSSGLKPKTDKAVNSVRTALADEFADFIIRGKDKSCESCTHGDSELTGEPCSKCTGKDKWEAKNG